MLIFRNDLCRAREAAYLVWAIGPDLIPTQSEAPLIRADLLALLGSVALAIALGAIAPLVWPVGSPTDRVVSTVAVTREYVRPPHKDLLSGKACIPLSELLLNRAYPGSREHSYSRSVACE